MSTNRHFDIIDAYKFTRLRNCSRIDLPETIINKDLIILQKNYKIFHDDQLNSFTRGVDFSPCGSIVFTPGIFFFFHMLYNFSWTFGIIRTQCLRNFCVSAIRFRPMPAVCISFFYYSFD